MNVLFDTNVVLDLLLDRAPHAEFAAALVARVERGELAGYLCATTITTVFYLAAKAIGSQAARQQIEQLLKLFEVAPVTRSVLEDALQAGFSDLEDAVLYMAARQVGAQCLVTRNTKDFKLAEIPIYQPHEFEAVLRSS